MPKVAVPIALLAMLFTAPLMAQPEVTSWTADGGGRTSSGGGFEVTGTLGQPDAGSASGGSLSVESGFWTSENPAVPVELMFFEIVQERSPASLEEVLATFASPPPVAGERLACRAPATAHEPEEHAHDRLHADPREHAGQ